MAYMVFIYIKAAAGRHSPPTAITNTALSASDCARCALVVLTACHLGAMYAHLQQKRSSQCSRSTSHIGIALPLPLCRSIEVYVLLRAHAMATTDSTPKVFSWADLQGKQGGFTQRDEIAHRKTTNCNAAGMQTTSDRATIHTGWNACSQLGLHRAIGCMNGDISTLAYIDYVESVVTEYLRRKARRQYPACFSPSNSYHLTTSDRC